MHNVERTNICIQCAWNVHELEVKIMRRNIFIRMICIGAVFPFVMHSHVALHDYVAPGNAAATSVIVGGVAGFAWGQYLSSQFEKQATDVNMVRKDLDHANAYINEAASFFHNMQTISGASDEKNSLWETYQQLRNLTFIYRSMMSTSERQHSETIINVVHSNMDRLRTTIRNMCQYRNVNSNAVNVFRQVEQLRGDLFIMQKHIKGHHSHPPKMHERRFNILYQRLDEIQQHVYPYIQKGAVQAYAQSKAPRRLNTIDMNNVSSENVCNTSSWISRILPVGMATCGALAGLGLYTLTSWICS